MQVVGVMKSLDVLSDYDLVLADDSDRDLELGAQRLQQATAKRLIDIVGAVFGLLFLAPVFALVALVIIIDSRGPVVFRQRRTGYDGVPFIIFKFRTMRVQEDGPAILQATRNDKRTTRIGKILRRTSIDELPQLLNVLRGDMSLVGPRPHPLALDHNYSGKIRGYRGRFKAKPGITGLAQVAGFRGEIKCLEHMEARVRADTDYIRMWTIGLDIQILVRTLLKFTRDAAAY
jgi:lipopolysaccharide/colanic/teichoic acid biosynthesis glycosyltransferase